MWIRHIGHYHPANVIPNHFFVRLDIGSNADWVEERTGIKSRRSVLSEDQIQALKEGHTSLERLRQNSDFETIADMAEGAYVHLKGRESLGVEVPDALICGTSIPDFDIPANACTIAARLGWQCPSFDVNSACSSFVVNLHVARGLIASGIYKNVAIFNPERYSLRINYADRGSAVLFGDGCAATYMSNVGHGGLRLLDTIIDGDPEKFATVQIPDGGRFSQNGAVVQKFAVSKTVEITREILRRNAMDVEDLAYFTGHQANLRMIESAVHRLGLNADRHLFNVDEFGNQGAAGAPSVLSMNWHKFKSKDRVCVAVVGSGLTWGAALFEFEEPLIPQQVLKP